MSSFGEQLWAVSVSAINGRLGGGAQRDGDPTRRRWLPHRHSGRCGKSPRVRNSRRTLTADSDIRNSRRISVRTMSRVHSASPGSTARTRTPAAADPFRRSACRAGASAHRTASAAAPAPGAPSAHRGRPRGSGPTSRRPCPAHAQRRRDILGMHPGLDRVHRSQSHRFERPVVQLAAVVRRIRRSSQLTYVRLVMAPEPGSTTTPR